MNRLAYCVSPIIILLQTVFSSAASAKEATLDDYLNLSLAELGEVKVSIATGNGIAFDKTPATASVIYAPDIDAMGAKTLDDVLETVPGFHVSISTINRMDSVYSIRGMHTGFSPEVLLLLNGVPVQSIQGAKPILFRLPVAAIERVEVIRGPGSAVYGADAFSGVINVITKDANSLENIQVGARAGSFNSHDIWAQGATEWRGWGIAFSTNYQETDGDNKRRLTSDLQSTFDTLFGTNASQAPGSLSTRYQILDNHLSFTNDQFDINLWNWRSTDAGQGAGAAQALDPTGHDEENILLADVTYHLPQISDVWDNNLHVSFQRLEQDVYFTLLPAGTRLPVGTDGNIGSPPIAGFVEFPDGVFGNPNSIMKDRIVDFISTFSGWNNQRIRIAIGSRRITADAGETKNFGPGVLNGTEGVRDGALVDVSNSPNIYMPNEARTSRYASLQDEWQIAKTVALTGGIRYDDYSDFGSTTNPRLALVWSTTNEITTKLLYGSAFRAPSFQELYFQNNPVSLGNESVKPERMDTGELSVNYRITPEFQSTLTLFKYQAQDLIEFIPDAGAPTKTAQNARDQHGKGLEWELGWKPQSQFRLTASYSWQDAYDAKTDADIPDAPGHQIKVNLNWEFLHEWFFNTQIYHVADRERAVGDLRRDIPDYTLANITLHRKNILRNLDVSLAVRNIADVSAYEPSSGVIPEDYPLEHRSAWLGVQYAFK